MTEIKIAFPDELVEIPEMLCYTCQWEEDCIGETVYLEDNEWNCDWYNRKHE